MNIVSRNHDKFMFRKDRNKTKGMPMESGISECIRLSGIRGRIDVVNRAGSNRLMADQAGMD
jgi:hypothetical protein